MFMLGLFSILLSSPANAEEIKVGQVYQGGQNLDISGLGVSFTIPNNWLGGLNNDGTILWDRTQKVECYSCSLQKRLLRKS